MPGMVFIQIYLLSNCIFSRESQFGCSYLINKLDLKFRWHCYHNTTHVYSGSRIKVQRTLADDTTCAKWNNRQSKVHPTWQREHNHHVSWCHLCMQNCITDLSCVSSNFDRYLRIGSRNQCHSTDHDDESSSVRSRTSCVQLWPDCWTQVTRWAAVIGLCTAILWSHAAITPLAQTWPR